MNIFFDAKFIDRPPFIDLISLGLVREDGQEYYAVSTDWERQHTSPWLEQHVLPQLPHARDKAWKSRETIATELIDFVGPTPHFYGHICAYGWVVMMQLFGPLMEKPHGWPMTAVDIRHLSIAWDLPIGKYKKVQPHHALADAWWVRNTFYALCDRR